MPHYLAMIVTFKRSFLTFFFNGGTGGCDIVQTRGSFRSGWIQPVCS